MARIVIRGEKELRAVLERAPEHALMAMGMAMSREAGRMLDKSKLKYVPIDQGTLVDSATLHKLKLIAPTVLVQDFGYGGAASAYAVIQHEDESLSHPPKNPGRKGTKSSARPGRAKYLSIAVEQATPTYFLRCAKAVDAMFRRIGK